MNIGKISEEIFKILNGQEAHIRMFNAEGDPTTKVSEALGFFTLPHKITVAIDPATGDVRISYSEGTSLDSIKTIRDAIKEVVVTQRARGFSVKKFGHELTPRDLKSEVVYEGFSKMDGSIRRSYQKTGDARIKIVHEKSIDEKKRYPRSRNIGKIFIENANGERFAMPSRSLPAARAMCNHVAHEGNLYDNIGTMINELAEEITTCRKLKKYGRANSMSEDMLTAASNRINYNKKMLKSLSSPRGYAKNKDNVDRLPDCTDCDVVMEEFGDVEQTDKIKEMSTMAKRLNMLDEAKVHQSDESMLQKAQNAEFTPLSANQAEYAASSMKFVDARAEVSFRLGELNARVRDLELSTYLGGIVYKLDTNASVDMDEIEVIQAILDRAKEEDAFSVEHVPVKKSKNRTPEEDEFEESVNGIVNEYFFFDEKPSSEITPNDLPPKMRKELAHARRGGAANAIFNKYNDEIEVDQKDRKDLWIANNASMKKTDELDENTTISGIVRNNIIAAAAKQKAAEDGKTWSLMSQQDRSRYLQSEVRRGGKKVDEGFFADLHRVVKDGFGDGVKRKLRSSIYPEYLDQYEDQIAASNSIKEYQAVLYAARDAGHLIGKSSIDEGKTKEIEIDLNDMSDEEFQYWYKMTKDEMRAEVGQEERFDEAEFEVDDEALKNDVYGGAGYFIDVVKDLLVKYPNNEKLTAVQWAIISMVDGSGRYLTHTTMTNMIRDAITLEEGRDEDIDVIDDEKFEKKHKMSKRSAARRRKVSKSKKAAFWTKPDQDKYIAEGLWSFPFSAKQVRELRQLLLAPLPAKTAEDKLYHILGDDELFDDIDDILGRENEGHVDVRFLVLCRLRELIGAGFETFSKPFEDGVWDSLEQLANTSSRELFNEEDEDIARMRKLAGL